MWSVSSTQAAMTVQHAQMWMMGAAIGLMGAACTQSESPATTKAEQKAEAAEAAEKKATMSAKELRQHMQKHFVKADELKNAVVAGDVAQTKLSATWFAEHEPDANLPAKYLPHAKKLMSVASKLTKANGPSDTAHGAADLAAACAQCHLSRGKPIQFGSDPEPAESDDLAKSHMARHAWAVTRMWDGLVGGSPKVYAAGAQVLSDLPMLAMSLKKNKKLSDAADHFIGNLSTEAERALKADTLETRAAVLGDVLSSCGNCHTMLNKGP